jgi:hypothetical protein
MASPVASAALKARIRRPSMLKKLCQPQDLLHHFPNGAYIGWSGFTGVGYPKYDITSASLPLACASANHRRTTGRCPRSWPTTSSRTACRAS